MTTTLTFCHICKIFIDNLVKNKKLLSFLSFNLSGVFPCFARQMVPMQLLFHECSFLLKGGISFGNVFF